jgi:hypothetical protein
MLRIGHSKRDATESGFLALGVNPL